MGSMWDFPQKFDWAVAQNYIKPKQEPQGISMDQSAISDLDQPWPQPSCVNCPFGVRLWPA